jgi:hypothetical protein
MLSFIASGDTERVKLVIADFSKKKAVVNGERRNLCQKWIGRSSSKEALGRAFTYKTKEIVT